MAPEAWFLPFRPNRAEILTELMQCLLILTVPVLLVELLAAAWRLPLYGLILAGMALTYLIRRTSRYLWQFILFSLAVLALFLYLPPLPGWLADVWPRLILTFTLVSLIVRAFLLRLNQAAQAANISSLQIQPLALLLVVGLNMLAGFLGLPVVGQIFLYLSIAYLVLTLVRWHGVALQQQLEHFLPRATQPTDRVIRYNRLLLTGLSIVLVILLLASPLLRLHELIPWLFLLILRLVRGLLAALQDRQPTETEPTAPPPPTPTPPGGIGEYREPPAWLTFLLQVLDYLVTAIVIIALVATVLYSLYLIYRRFNASHFPESDRREHLLPNLAGVARERLRLNRQRWREQYGRTPDQRIRRAYFRLIESQIRLGLDWREPLTARQLAGQLDQVRYPEIATVTDLYEKARYGGDRCTPVEAATMQSLVRRLQHQNLLTLPDATGRSNESS